MTTALFTIGLAAAVAGIALVSIPAAAIVLGLALMTVAVLIERGGTTQPDPPQSERYADA